MKKLTFFLLISFFSISLLQANDDLRDGFKTGDPEIKSMNAIFFGPDGILFVGDSERAEVIAIDTKDNAEAAKPESLNIQEVDAKIAALLGTTADAITIQDMAVNPISKVIYLAVHTQDGTPVLVRTNGDQLEVVATESVSFDAISLEKAVAADAKDRRGRSLREWSISDLAYANGNVMVSGLSNEEFSSSFRMIPFPFKDKQQFSSLEIYHAAHGRYETYAPIKTFMPYELAGEPHLMASYTCTPLVIFPMKDLKPGQHTKGKTVAELGNRNTPVDMVTFKKGDKEYILMANTSRALMKIDPEKIAGFKDYLTEPVSESSATAGVDFIALPYVNVQQLDKLDDETVVMLQRTASGDLNLFSTNAGRL